MRPLSLIFGVLLTLGGVFEIALAYVVSSASDCGYSLSCTGPHGGLTFGGFRLMFGVLLVVIGIVLIVASFRPRRWGMGGPGAGGWRRGIYGPGYGGYGPRRGGMGGPLGAPLICGTCGGRNGPQFQYCRFCGAALSGPGRPQGGVPPPPP